MYSEKCDTNRLFEMPVEVYKYIYMIFKNFFPLKWSLAKCGFLFVGVVGSSGGGGGTYVA